MHKRRLTVDELMRLGANRIAQLAERPAPFELPTPTYRSDAAALAERDARRTARRDSKAADKPKRTPGQRKAAVRRRFGLLNTFLDGALPHLGRTDIAAWLLLYRHARPDGTVSASVADLARRAGCCDRAMRNALGRLRTAGLLDRLKRGTLAGGPSVWRLRAPDSADPNRHRDAG